MALSEPVEFGHPDFILLDEVKEDTFMANLKLRYEKGKVSTEINLIYYNYLFHIIYIYTIILLYIICTF